MIHHFLERSAKKNPDKIAIVHDSERVDYQRLNYLANCMARHLIEHGIQYGDRIALLLENSVDYVVAYYGVLKAGAVAVPLNPGLKPKGLSSLLEDFKPVAMVLNFKSERLLKAVQLDARYLKLLIIRDAKQNWHSAPVTVSFFPSTMADDGDYSGSRDELETDLASIIYTSGSTGEPKGVMLSHGNIVSNTLSICKSLSLKENDIQMVVLPFFYVMGKSLLNTHIASGGTIVINNRFIYPADVLNQMVEENVTGFSGVPSTYAYLLHRSPLASSREKLTSLRYCSQAGGHMAASLKQDLRKALPENTQIFIMYGATEAAARLTYLQPEFYDSKIGSIGKPIDGVKVSIRDDNMNEVPDGSEGELVAEGPNIMMGYWNDQKDTQRVLSEYGYRTGDIGYRDQDGFFYVTRRRDELLKVSGHRVNPVQIEEFLIGTGEIMESAVVGLPDDLTGNRLVAMVVCKDEYFELEKLKQQCATHLPRHYQPAEIIQVRALPKNASGKIDKQECKRKANAKAGLN